MTIFGIGLHVLVAIFFAIHAIRSGQQLYWVVILFLFPGLGSIVYFFAVYLPNSKLQHGARKAVNVAARTLDPGRELREARDAYEFTPTAQNQMRLASALLEAGNAEEAAATYEACLQGPFSGDLEIRLGAARATLASGRAAAAVAHLQTIRGSDDKFRPEQVSLLLAQALAAAGRQDEARAEFELALSRYNSFTVQAEFAIWAAGVGDAERANQLYAELQRTMERWARHTRDLNQQLVRRLNTAMSSMNR
ncbi:tetratricopeptide repeat protein [Pseudoduganella sp. FT25W]|uniref:Tetratricopeptide repeat protein n=1 Tax=Duganella alba TaxID=2666081 RepID=A0A6L5QG78_9BURK|nr:tetratricopeptide repeat protein [Duganella alba]MRX08640.1 tetratricopeptide repeat protein [Duganella alba]MRX18202.1 tetratricopeptide repeat protein [Duganella alba]